MKYLLAPSDEFGAKGSKGSSEVSLWLQGLSTEEALDRFRINGANILSPSHQSSFFVVFTKEMFSGFSLLLWLGSLLCFSSYGVHRAQGDKGSDEVCVCVAL